MPNDMPKYVPKVTKSNEIITFICVYHFIFVLLQRDFENRRNLRLKIMGISN